VHRQETLSLNRLPGLYGARNLPTPITARVDQMHPRLFSSTRLRTSSPLRVQWSNVAGFTLLLLILGCILLIRSRTETSAIPIARPGVLSVSYIKGTQVPAPPSAYGMRQNVARAGKAGFVPGSRGFSPESSKRLFDFYLNSMIPGGWTYKRSRTRVSTEDNGACGGRKRTRLLCSISSRCRKSH
jgi:hypothetical protein